MSGGAFVALEIRRGNIADQPDLEAIVNAANAALAPGGGVAGAIHRAAGPGLHEECRPLAPIRPGEAVITGGHGLPNRFVIHCLGPVFGQDEPEAVLLGACYARVLDLAEAHRLRSLGFPAISTGVFGYPPEAAARVAWGTVLARLPTLSSLRLIRFVLFSEADRLLHERVLAELSRADRA
ncbi:MAG TPA: macro domain-containing protein [Acetobacteraceae bacterium]|nr:macro domain-containing protein [Acetobacteraceae bacterium]